MRFHRAFFVACLSVVYTVALCSGAATATRDLSEVEAFDAYPVYSAGEEVAGLHFEVISKHEQFRDQRSTFWNFSYGNCTPPGNGACDPQLHVQSWSTCYRWFSSFRRKRHLFNLRGAKASGGEGGSELEIFTGRSTVVIFAYSHSLAMAAARQLRKVGQTEAPAVLPPPVPGSLGGKLPCQKPWWEEAR